jgi:uncharacterized short protein YbdD (DUF466 family)
MGQSKNPAAKGINRPPATVSDIRGDGTPLHPQGRRPALAQARLVCDAVARTARLMVGVPDYDAYLAHRARNHPSQPAMSYAEFFRNRQQARYAFDKGRFRGCC